jgi:multicomponent Na+:H+ antiporter subunit D
VIELTPSLALGLAVAIPGLGAGLVALCGRWPDLRDAITVIVGCCTLAAVLCLVSPVLAGARPELELFAPLPGVTLAFHAEPLGVLFALLASGLWIVTSFYAFGYMRAHHERNQTRFFVCFAIAIASALGIALSRNLLTLFLFYEILTFSTYPLVAHHGTESAKRGARIYLSVLVSTSILFLLLAIVWTHQLCGTLEFKQGGIFQGRLDNETATILLALFAFGVGKAALMPFHHWLPAAMVAPTPVSALLHAVAVVKAGVFTILKIAVYVFGLDYLRESGISEWLMYVASITILLASIRALQMDNLKARLAYSTVSQLSYVVLGAALATPVAALGAGMHIAMHAVGKITLFFCAGAVYVAHHKTTVSEMDGVGRRMPFTMGAFFVGALCIIGLPPLGGAWSKWYLMLGAFQAHEIVFVGVLMASSLLSVGYLMPVVVRAFLPTASADRSDGSDEASSRRIEEAPALVVVPLCLTAAACVAFFFFAEEIYELLLPLVGAAASAG